MAKRTLSSLGRDREGSAAVELGLVMPVLAMLLAGATDLGIALWHHHTVVTAARDAVRYLTRVPEPWDSAAYQAEAVNLARTGTIDGSGQPLADNIQAAFIFPKTSVTGFAGGDRMVRGVVSFDYSPLTGFGFLPAVTLRAGHVERHIGE